MRMKSMLAAALTVVLSASLVGFTGQPDAAQAAVTPTEQPIMPAVPGKKVPVKPPASDPASEAAKAPMPAAAWPDAAAVTATASGGRSIQVRMLDRAAAREAGVTGALLQLDDMTRVPAGEKVNLTVDYSRLRNLYGGDWANRLRLVDVEKKTALPTTNDAKRGRVSATVEAGSAGSTFALTADSGGSTGTFAATSLSPAGKWSVSTQSGAFTWSYNLRMPPAPGGLIPELGLSYSSAAVDGRTSSTNNQPSWIGEGWNMWPGYIERSYRSCSDTEGKPKVYDLCWITENAVMSLNGQTTELVRESATSNRWRPKEDDGTRVQQLFDTAANDDVRGEYWVVTTTNGHQYRFGSRKAAESTWTVPVFGDSPGTGCGGTFATSDCVHAWRWNLDYVVDPHANTIGYQYRAETNKYARNMTDSSVATYARGGYLERIDYGGRVGEQAAAQVAFTVADRCVPGQNCSQHNGTAWPDVPWDQDCAATACPGKYSPTFWSTKRLASITTRIRSGTAYADVDRWTLDQIYPDPGDGTSAGLWLRGITPTGLVGGSLTQPPVTFLGTRRENRVDSYTDGPPQMFKFRVETVHNGTGGDINVVYAPTNCVAGALPTPSTNTQRCFPARWTFEPEPQPRDDWFHRYVVQQITLVDRVAGGTTEVFSYEYLGGAAWRYDDNPVTAEKYRTWSTWRGYEKVKVRHGDSGRDPDQKVSLTQFQYFRGMNGDRATPTGGTKTVTVTDSTNTSLTDADPLAGTLREQITYNGDGGAELSGTINDPWISAATASQGTLQAFQVETVRTVTRTALAAGGYRKTQVDTTFDHEGNPTTVSDLGDVATTADDRCTRTEYARNETTWLLTLPSRVSTVGVACGATPAYPADAISDVRTFYDNLSVWDAAPTVGDATKVEDADSYQGNVATYLTTARMTYDAYGRVLDATDALSRTTSTRYQPAQGPTTGKTVTNALNQAESTTLDPGRGLPVAMVATTGARTDLTYDPLGQLTQVWLPGRPKASFAGQPSFRYAYRTQEAAPSWIRTDRITAKDTYVSSFAVYDGFLRQRQVQAPSPEGGRIVTDTLTDSRGLAYLSRGPYRQDLAPDGTLIEPDINLVPSMNLTRFDGAERPTEQIFLKYNAEPTDGRWRTSTTYGGDRVSVNPPTGGTATTALVDARGRTTELWQYRGSSPSGDHDVTRYQYTKAGALAQVTDPAGNIWRYQYDVRGRKTLATDPDAGQTTAAYDAAGQVLSTTDARNQQISYDYDVLGRRTATRLGSTVLARWTYDTLKPGLLTSSTRYQAGGEYTTAVTGYDDADRSTGIRVTFPGTEIGVVGTASFTTTQTYKADGSPSIVRLPEISSDVPAETLTFSYDDLGLPYGLKGNTATGSTTYVNRATYTALGEPKLIELGNPDNGPLVWEQWTYEAATRRLATILTEREQVDNLRVDQVSYGYDPAGNVKSIKDELPGVAVDNQCFRYDYLRRTTDAWTQTDACATSPIATVIGGPAAYWQTYGYDVTGNRTSLTVHGLDGIADKVSTYAYPAAGQARPHAVSTVATPGSTTATYGYDAAGHTTSRPGPAGQQTLTWDAEGKLASIDSAAGTVGYRYDADGNQLIRRDPATVTVFLGDSELVFAVGTRTRSGTRYYGFGGRTIASRAQGAVQWLVGDHHGTSQLTVNPATLQATPRRFDPFGNPRGASTTWPGGTRGFVGGTSNDATGLTRLGAREYDPSIGRFVSVDPIMDSSDPQQMNGYAYANNSPASASDPDGLRHDVDLGGQVSVPGAAAAKVLGAARYNNILRRAQNKAATIAKREFLIKLSLPVTVGGKKVPKHVIDMLRNPASGYQYHGSDAFTYADAYEFAAQGEQQYDFVCQALGGSVGACHTPDWLEKHMGDIFDVLTSAFQLGLALKTLKMVLSLARHASEPYEHSGGPTVADPAYPGLARTRCPRSFSSDTLVMMADGTTKPIEDVRVGDQVLAADPRTAGSSAGTVIATWVHGDELVDLQIGRLDGSGKATVTTTDDHLFWNETDRQWEPASAIDPGDRL
ncbi:MAG: RHS repeat protein, partial [Hamadaea sp.]|nr:RHS repeat protein [Hamadaea sp.]